MRGGEGGEPLDAYLTTTGSVNSPLFIQRVLIFALCTFTPFNIPKAFNLIHHGEEEEDVDNPKGR